MSSGIISFDYAYFLGKYYIQMIPDVKTLLQKRFCYIFVDEMQDMDEHQYDLLENIFYNDGNSISIYQRIGDKNQAIYNLVKVSDIWKDRDLVLPLNGSHRLSKPIANVVENFSLHRDDTFKIVSLRNGEIKPHILVYNDDTIKDVIPHFANIVNTYIHNGKLTDVDKYPVKVISWNTEWKTQEDKEDITKIRLVDYHSIFEKNMHKPKQDYDQLISYLIYFDKEKSTLRSIRKNILHALLKVLRLEEIEDENQRNYTKRTLLKYFHDKDLLESSNYYEPFKLHLYNWSIGIIRDNTEIIWNEIKTYIPEFLQAFGQGIAKSNNFINDNVVKENEGMLTSYKKSSSSIKVDDLNIEITTVHSAKGQTHCATLYLESFYHQDGRGKNAKSYESQRLAAQFLGNPIAGDAGTRVKESLRMAYVGFSRATNLLCVAIHQDRFNNYLNRIDRNKWEVKEVVAIKSR